MKVNRIVNPDIYRKEGFSVFNNCIYVGFNSSRGRWINNRLYGN